jgi:hypothetical protein
VSDDKQLRVLSGIAASAAALGVAQLVAAPFGPPADALNAVGSARGADPRTMRRG